MSDCPRTQSSRASSQSALLVAMKGGILVFLKQPISAPRLVALVVGGGEVDVRGFRVNSCAGETARRVAKTEGSGRENSKNRGCISSGIFFFFFFRENAESGRRMNIEQIWKREQIPCLSAPEVANLGTS